MVKIVSRNMTESYENEYAIFRNDILNNYFSVCPTLTYIIENFCDRYREIYNAND